MAGAPSIASLFAQRVIIGVGDMAVSNNASVTLSTYALGSCIGVVAYDPGIKAGGLLHFMLPDSTISPDKAKTKPAMFADTGMPMMMRALNGLHVDPSRMRLFLAGGACVLQGTDPFKIGERNIEAVKRFVQKYNLRVIGSDVGGIVNRTVHLEISTGKITMKLPNGVENISMAG
jgi:chemotaxis protein CheD